MKPGDAALLPPGVVAARVRPWREGRSFEQPDWIAEERPVALVFNGISHAVMLASPADLDDFALGFAISEGLLESPAELYGIERVDTAEGIELQLEVASAALWRLKDRRRTMAGRTGCGLCGTDSLAQLRRPLPVLRPVQVEARAPARAQRELRALQAVQQLTGASHAAAWCTKEGRVLMQREDIGRHNALDKLIGGLLRGGLDRSAGFVAITSRASFEMVQKSAMAGIAALAAVSAPTALAVECARECGLALAGFVRGDDFVAYTFAERFGLDTEFSDGHR